MFEGKTKCFTLNIFYKKAVMKYWLWTILFMFWNINGIFAQVDMTPAEFQSLMETIQTTKPKRKRSKRRRRIIRPMYPSTGNNSVSEVVKNQTLNEKLNAIEQLLIEQQAYSDIDRSSEDEQRALQSIKNDLRLALENIQNREVQPLKNSELADSTAISIVTNNQIMPTDSTTNILLLSILDRLEKMEKPKEVNQQTIVLSDPNVVQDTTEQIQIAENTTDLPNQNTNNTTNVTNLDTTILITTNITESDKAATDDSEMLGFLSKQLQSIEKQLVEVKAAQNPLPSSVKEPANSTDLSELYQRFDRLEQRLSTINTLSPSGTTNTVEKTIITESADLSAILSRLEAIERNMDNQLKAIDDLPRNNTNRTTNNTTITTYDDTYLALQNLIAGRDQQSVYFENGLADLSPKSKVLIEEISVLMQSNSRLDILLKGFTSAKGTPMWNQSLSQLRAEKVKKYLMEQGIHADRIYTEYHGIDYSAPTVEAARRVEMRLLIRKP